MSQRMKAGSNTARRNPPASWKRNRGMALRATRGATGARRPMLILCSGIAINQKERHPAPAAAKTRDAL